MCTSLSILDALGSTYVGRTMEFAGAFPWQLSYFPKGLKFTSTITNNENGISYQTSLGFISITLSTDASANQSNYQDLKAIHGLNEAGLNFGVNAFPLTQGLTIEEDKIPTSLAFIDIGSWALGQFKTVAEVKAALSQQLIYCTPIATLQSNTTPLHCVFYDPTGASIVVEYFQGKQCIYDNPVGVMTNGPEFAWHLTNLNNYTNLSNIDCNQTSFGTLQVKQPDSGIATSVIPSPNTSVGRFIKSVYYSQFALKAKTPDEAVYMLSHIMNNFDRPLNITVDPQDSNNPSPEGKGDSEFTVWTALSDLSRRKFFVRSYLELNYQQFDLDELSNVTDFTTIPYMSKYQGLGSSDSQVLVNA